MIRRTARLVSFYQWSEDSNPGARRPQGNRMSEFVDGFGSGFFAPEAQGLLAPRFSVGN